MIFLVFKELLRYLYTYLAQTLEAVASFYSYWDIS